ncbi:triose-phosphate isomerase [Aureimonas frigidaquae]|uniref:Triosephosphate isomerase n=1 Tax=Aureimonas frigidaquae TaxID=424757 RepID=A0A0N7KY10_9HYPH|nr:triose-phosphate isomerase [Aureimonas frigidaquae]BAT28417.1 triosephosphate isomerase [Aureimonas frigidaquae]
MQRRKLVAGNWKMNGVRASLSELHAMRDAVRAGQASHVDLLICPPATLLAAAVTAVDGAFHIGGQTCHDAPSGAYTGEVSAAMLADAGARYVILGHSERRTLFGETDAMVRSKAQAAAEAGLIRIVCVGETESERLDGRALDVIERQLAASLPDAATGADMIVAYEPVWAIGTGRTPTLEDVAQVHRAMRTALVGRYGEQVGQAMRLLYGGSVKSGNCAELMAAEDVDGALVGGASLKSADIMAICAAIHAV